MADNFTQCTVTPALPLDRNPGIAYLLTEWVDFEDLEDLNEENCKPDEWAATQLAMQIKLDDDYFVLDYSRDYDQELGEFCYYLYSRGNGLTEEHATILQMMLHELPEDDFPYIEVEGAHTCSKMRQGEFGGFACFITRKNIRWVSTGMWLEEQRQELLPGGK
jgi:hypothetical protein